MKNCKVEKSADRIVSALLEKVAEHFAGDKKATLQDVFNENGQGARNMLRSLLQMNAAGRKNPELKDAIIRRAECAGNPSCDIMKPSGC